MSGLEIRLNRLEINLHGISAQTVEQAMADLDGVLRRRLQGRELVGAGDLDIAELSLGPVEAEPGIDAAGLRALIAEQIEHALVRAIEARGAEATTDHRGAD